MSLARVETLASKLPFTLREQVLGYAKSVDDAFPAILAELEQRLRPRATEFRDQLVLIAGVKKLYALSAGTFWSLENSASLLDGMGVSRISIGSSDFSRGSDLYNRLRALTGALEKALTEADFTDLRVQSPKEILIKLVQNAD